MSTSHEAQQMKYNRQSISEDITNFPHCWDDVVPWASDTTLRHTTQRKFRKRKEAFVALHYEPDGSLRKEIQRSDSSIFHRQTTAGINRKLSYLVNI